MESQWWSVATNLNDKVHTTNYNDNDMCCDITGISFTGILRAIKLSFTQQWPDTTVFTVTHAITSSEAKNTS